MTQLTKASLCLVLRDCVAEYDRLVIERDALAVANERLNRQLGWFEDQQARGYRNEAGFVPILPRKVS